MPTVVAHADSFIVPSTAERSPHRFPLGLQRQNIGKSKGRIEKGNQNKTGAPSGRNNRAERGCSSSGQIFLSGDLTDLRLRCVRSSPQKKFADRGELFSTQEGGTGKFSACPSVTAVFFWFYSRRERAFSQKETIMGYDIFGQNPTAPEGEYYRSNIWYWPPFVAMCRRLAPRESKGCKGWTVNDGHGLNAANALRLANRLEELLADGTIAAYIEETGEPPVTELQATALKFISTLTKNTSGSQVDTPGLAAPAVTEEDVREFIGFLKTCGGFTIM
jgi:hypothetical protein